MLHVDISAVSPTHWAHRSFQLFLEWIEEVANDGIPGEIIAKAIPTAIEAFCANLSEEDASSFMQIIKHCGMHHPSVEDVTVQ